MVRPPTTSESVHGQRRRRKSRADSPGRSRRQTAIQAAMHGFHRTFGVFHKISRTASGREVTLTDVFLLHFIGIHGEQTPKGIAAFTGLTSGSVTSMLDRLERAGLVLRARSTMDRRVVLVSLTSKTREKLAETLERAHMDIDRLFGRWTTEEIETFATLLEKFGSADLEPSTGRRPYSRY